MTFVLGAVLVSSSDQAALGLLRVASAAPASAAAKAAQGSMRLGRLRDFCWGNPLPNWGLTIKKMGELNMDHPEMGI